jgi:hypothetical protein
MYVIYVQGTLRAFCEERQMDLSVDAELGEYELTFNEIWLNVNMLRTMRLASMSLMCKVSLRRVSIWPQMIAPPSQNLAPSR